MWYIYYALKIFIVLSLPVLLFSVVQVLYLCYRWITDKESRYIFDYLTSSYLNKINKNISTSKEYDKSICELIDATILVICYVMLVALTFPISIPIINFISVLYILRYITRYIKKRKNAHKT